MHRYTQSCGISLTYDSENYIVASNSWASKGVFENKDGSLFLQQPPLYPFILAVFAPYQLVVASYLNTCFLLLTVGLWLYWVDKFVHHAYYQIMCSLLLILATPLYLVHQFLWSEPLFLAIWSLHLYSLFQYQEKNKPEYLSIAIFLGALLPLQRVVGIAFIVGGFFLARGWKLKITYLLLTYLPFLLWVVWVLQHKTPTEFSATYGVQDQAGVGLYMLWDGFALWFLPAYVLWVGKAIVILCIFWVGKYRKQIQEAPFLQSLFYSSLFYLLILGIKKSDFSDNERFIALLYPIFLLLLFTIMPVLHGKKQWVVIALMSLYQNEI
jgi:hypothetical protein